MGAFFPFLRCGEGSWPGSVWGTGLCVHANIQGAPSDRALKGAECEGRVRRELWLGERERVPLGRAHSPASAVASLASVPSAG